MNRTHRVSRRAAARGQSLVFAVFTLFGLAIASLMILGVARATSRKIRVQNAADTAALALVQIETDSLAQIAWINEALASLYADILQDCSTTAARAVQAEIHEGVGLTNLTDEDWEWLTTDAIQSPHWPAIEAPIGPDNPKAPNAIATASDVTLWAAARRNALTRVPRAERWMHRLSQLEYSIAVLTPELMRHQAHYTARRNLAGEEKDPDILTDKALVALYPDLNLPGNVLFASGSGASFQNLHILKIGNPGTPMNGWRGWSDTNGLEFEFVHEGSVNASDNDPPDPIQKTVYGKKIAEWTDHWHGFISRGVGEDTQTTRFSYKYFDELQQYYRDNKEYPANITSGGKSDYWFFRSESPEGVEEKLFRYRRADDSAGRRTERLDIFDVGSDTGLVAIIKELPGGGRELTFWDLPPYSFDNLLVTPPNENSYPPTRKVRENANGTLTIWNDNNGWVDLPQSVTLPSGIKVPVQYARTFRYLTWVRPFTIHMSDMVARIPADGPAQLEINTLIGCHGWLRFSPDDRTAFIHDLSTNNTNAAWKRVNHFNERGGADRLRHRLYDDPERADDLSWVYEWTDPGPYLAEMNRRRFGYHALMEADSNTRGAHFEFPDEADIGTAEYESRWETLEKSLKLWARRPAPFPENGTNPAGDLSPDPPLAAEAYGGWFDFASGRPFWDGVALSQTHPCWYCGDKGVEGPLTDLINLDDNGNTVQYNQRPCGFWHEIFATAAEATQRRMELRDHGLVAQTPGSNPRLVQVTCPFNCRWSWTDGSRPRDLAEVLGKDKRDIKSHIRVTLRDASARAFLHDSTFGEAPSVRRRINDNFVDIKVSSKENGRRARPPRDQRLPDFGYRHVDKTTHWTRDYFGVFRDNPQNLREREPVAANDDLSRADYQNDNINPHSPYRGTLVIPMEDDRPEQELGWFVDPIGFWSDDPSGRPLLNAWAAPENLAYLRRHVGRDRVTPPLEISSFGGGGQLFRQGWVVMVWSEPEGWLEKIFPPGTRAPRTNEVSAAYRQTVANQVRDQDWTGQPTDNLPPGGGEREWHWSHGLAQPLRDPEWGYFGIAGARPFFPDPDNPSRHISVFPWRNVDVHERDLLERVVNPDRQRWLNGPSNLFEPDWRAALTPLAGTVDLRDIEGIEQGGETDMQWLFRNLPERVFRHGVTDPGIDGLRGGQVRQEFTQGLVAPPMQGENAGRTLNWTGLDGNGRGIEQVLAK